MQARIPNPAITVPGAMDALLALSKSATKAGIPHRTLDLVHLRASQINGCARLRRHARQGPPAGRRDRRADLRRRRLARGAVLHRRRAGGAGPGRVRHPPRRSARRGARRRLGEAAAHYDEAALAALVVDIAAINAWNRLNAATRQVAGAWAG